MLLKGKRMTCLLLSMVILLTILPQLPILAVQPDASENAVVTVAAEDTAGGTCGDDAQWSLDDNGTLTIFGSGEIADYDATFRPTWNGELNYTGCAPWFEQRLSISKVIVEDGITGIGEYAFLGLRNAREILLPQSVSHIGKAAFYHCTALTSLSIPEGVTQFEMNVFRYCTGLTTMFIPASVTSIGAHAFANCTGLTTVTIPDSVTSIDNYAFAQCSSLNSITLPEGATDLGVGLFSGCSSLTSMSIPEGATRVGNYMFADCSNLTDVTIPESVASFCMGSFSFCTSLTAVAIPKDVTVIEDQVFYGCSSLSCVTIPEGVTHIGNSAFYGCSSLTAVTIPESVISIGSYAFCSTNLQQIIFLGAPPSGGENCFQGVQGATASYPCAEPLWTQQVQTNYSGSITWTCGHDLKQTTVVAPTCTEDGYTLHTCTKCGNTTKENVVPATGHTFVDGKCHCGKLEIGDVSGDGKINIGDVSKVFAYVRKKSTLMDETVLVAADVNGDGKINLGDVARIFTHVRGKNPLF